MQYYAKTNTADPRTGFITIGEVLTKKQADALGEEKLNELVEAGVLGIVDNSPAPAKAKTSPAKSSTAKASAAKNDSADDEDEEDEDLPELGLTEDMVNDADTKPAASKSGGRRKSK